jgi:Uma2 family endonuclease
MSAAFTPMSSEELLTYSSPNARTELVAGRLIVREPAGYRHGKIAAELSFLIQTFVRAHKLGEVVASDTGFTLFRDPDTVRAPDVAFISTARMPTSPELGFANFAPDLAVEVLSPSERAGEVLNKVGDLLNAGTRLVWVIDPARRSARAYRADGTVALLDEHDALDGEAVLPGFLVTISELLD